MGVYSNSDGCVCGCWTTTPFFQRVAKPGRSPYFKTHPYAQNALLTRLVYKYCSKSLSKKEERNKGKGKECIESPFKEGA